jgi:hypothetical protein
MKAIEQQAEFLSWKIAPARLNASQAAWYLGFEPHEITILIGDGLLKPLGHPARNATKFFATETLEQLRRDEKWLARATDAIAEYCERETPSSRLAGVAPRGAKRSADLLTQVADPLRPRRELRQLDDAAFRRLPFIALQRRQPHLGFAGVSAMHRLAVMSKRLLREPLRVAALFGALRPGVTIRMQGDTFDAQTLAALFELGRPVAAADRSQAENSGGVLKHRLERDGLQPPVANPALQSFRGEVAQPPRTNLSRDAAQVSFGLLD